MAAFLVMRVKLKMPFAGPKATWTIGQIVDVPAAIAKLMIDRGAGVPVETQMLTADETRRKDEPGDVEQN